MKQVTAYLKRRYNITYDAHHCLMYVWKKESSTLNHSLSIRFFIRRFHNESVRKSTRKWFSKSQWHRLNKAEDFPIYDIIEAD
jgi:hypothetical protein